MSRDGDKLAVMPDLEDGATSVAAIEGLHAKYVALITLRTEAAAGAPPPPRETLRALARRFPGALRELDQRGMPELLARRDLLAAHLAGAVPELPPWVALQVRYHGILRAALKLKADKAWSPLRAGEALADLCGREGAPPLSFWSPARLAQLRQPPGGRLNPLAAGWAAENSGVSEERAKSQLFPHADLS